jgi:hypothetical protein
MMNPFQRIGGPAPVPGFGRGVGGGGGNIDYGPRPAAQAPAPWTKKPTFTQDAELFRYADPEQKKFLEQGYAQMVGSQTEALRKQQAKRDAALQGYAGDFQSRYGQPMAEEFKSAYAGAAPQLGKIQSLGEFAKSKGFYQVGRDFAYGAPSSFLNKMSMMRGGGMGS